MKKYLENVYLGYVQTYHNGNLETVVIAVLDSEKAAEKWHKYKTVTNENKDWTYFYEREIIYTLDDLDWMDYHIEKGE